MAQILDKQGLQHYANKMCNADNRKVGSKSLPTALNDIDTAIDGFKTLFESEYGTPVNMELTNNQNIFTVGTSTDIDKKDDVENSFTDLTLNGNSLVNCIKKGAFLNSSNFTAFENNPIVKGEKITLTSRGNTNQTRISLKPDQGIIKPNTKYTFIFNVFENTLSGRMYLTYTNNNAIDVSYFPYQNFIEGKSTGQFKYVLTSTSDVSNVNCLFRTMIWNDSVADESITFSVIILEGDWTNKPIPQYFEGMKSIGEKEDGNHKISISSVGKNLLKLNLDSFEYNGIRGTRSGDKLILNGTCTERFTARLTPNKFNWAGNPFNLEKNSTYTLSSNYTKSRVNIMQYDTWNIALSKKEMATSLTGIIPTDACDNLFAYIIIEKGLSFNNEEFWFMLEKTNSFTSYESYKEDKKEILLNEPLRGLPNGVKDTIEQINGEWKLIRRTGEKILRKTDSIQVTFSSPYYDESYSCLFFSMGIAAGNFGDKLPKATAGNSAMMCSLLPQQDFSWGSEAEGFKIGSNVDFNIRKTKLNSIDSNGVKEYIEKMYLEGAPFKIIYELATPIIEDISPVTLQCWKNGTISIDEVLPVETTHTVALNKSAQIQKNIEELTTLRNRVKALEEQYDKTALNQAYEVELLRLDMQLDNII